MSFSTLKRAKVAANVTTISVGVGGVAEGARLDIGEESLSKKR
jgi:hypothetical protein